MMLIFGMYFWLIFLIVYEGGLYCYFVGIVSMVCRSVICLCREEWRKCLLIVCVLLF